MYERQFINVAALCQSVIYSCLDKGIQVEAEEEEDFDDFSDDLSLDEPIYRNVEYALWKTKLRNQRGASKRTSVATAKMANPIRVGILEDSMAIADGEGTSKAVAGSFAFDKTVDGKEISLYMNQAAAPPGYKPQPKF